MSRHRKSRLARKLEYWTRQLKRAAILLIIATIVILLAFFLIWLLPKLFEWALGD